MNAEDLHILASKGDTFRVSPCKWLWVRDEGDHYSVTLANGPTSHFPLFTPAIGVDFTKTGKRRTSKYLSGVWKSAISMWPVREPEECNRIEKVVRKAVSVAARRI